MRVCGAVTLVVIGAQSLRQARRAGDAAGAAEPVEDRAATGWRRSYLLGLGTILANPKAAVFAVSFLPQFVPAGADAPATLTLLALIWVTVDTLWYLALVWLIGLVRAVFDRPAVRRRMEQISGGMLIGLGVRLATEAR